MYTTTLNVPAKVWTMLDNAGCSKYGNFSQDPKSETIMTPSVKVGVTDEGSGSDPFLAFSPL